MKGSLDNLVNLKFSELAERREKALICYIVGGYPNIDQSKIIIENIIDSGADMIELGIPFSDPMADGPVIQNASAKALGNGVTPKQCFTLVKKIKENYPNTPILIMTYSNLVFSQDLTSFLKTAKDSKIDGLIIPDLTFDEASEYLDIVKKFGLSTPFLTSPNTENERIKMIAKVSTGFVYMVSVFGITGSRTKFENYTFQAIKRTQIITSKQKVPLAVGFGIGNSGDARKLLKSGADGIIVGSSIINRISNNIQNNDKMINDLRTFVKELKSVCL